MQNTQEQTVPIPEPAAPKAKKKRGRKPGWSQPLTDAEKQRRMRAKRIADGYKPLRVYLREEDIDRAILKFGGTQKAAIEAAALAGLEDYTDTDGQLTLLTAERDNAIKAAKERSNEIAKLRTELKAVHSAEADAAIEMARLSHEMPGILQSIPETGRFGDRCFIRAVYDALPPRWMYLEYTDFQARLLEANRYGLLRLSRADLTPAMDAALVEASETRGFGEAVFHFVEL